MGKNRTTTHRGKVGNAKHNEHRFYSKENRDTALHAYINAKDYKWNLTMAELAYYKRYAGQLEEQNQKYKERRQYSRMKTMEQFYNSKRYKPTEEIYQYGHAGGEVPDKETYIKMSKEYVRRKREWSKKHGNHLRILDWADHFDEATPHTHEREIWEYEDENGILRIGQEEAMKRAGIELPDPEEPEGRFNNRAITYTNMCRKMWQDICEEYGFEVEREPLLQEEEESAVPKKIKKRKSESVPQYHARKGRELEEKEQDILTREKAVKEKEKLLEDARTQADEIIKQAKEKALEESEEIKNKAYEEGVKEAEKQLKEAKEKLESAKDMRRQAMEARDEILEIQYNDVPPEYQSVKAAVKRRHKALEKWQEKNGDLMDRIQQETDRSIGE